MDSIGCLMENIRNNPIEEEELSFPVRVERYELRDEGPAPGRWRGGLGVIRATRSLGEGWVTSEAERQFDPPKGLFGGHNGRTAKTEVRRADGSVLELPSKFTSFKLLPGDVIEFRTACGGGYGDPLERDPEAVARDARDKLVTVESARDDYGVVLDPRTLALDREATDRARAAARQPTVTPSGSTP
jgi:N-methylhydantoinase B/oxoprolinase/acetone carboxylase alpha subunit